MSRFKSLFLFAVLLIGLSGLAQGAAFAEGGAPVALQGPEQRVALVIGNSKYRNVVQLPNSDNDAQSVAQLLNSAGFEVIAATDLTQNDMIKACRIFRRGWLLVDRTRWRWCITRDMACSLREKII